MPDNPAVAILQQQIRDIHLSPKWQRFRNVREVWDNVRRREQDEDLGELLECFGVDATSQSPILEVELATLVAVQLENAAKIDMYSLDKSEKAKGHVEDMRIYGAARIMQEDEGRKHSKIIFESLDRYGIWYGFKTWKMPSEPDPLERDDGEEDDAYESRLNKHRSEHYGKVPAGEKFGWEYPSVYEMSHWPTREPTIFLQVSEIPYVQARELKQNRLADKPFRLLKGDKRIHWGEPTPEAGEVAREEWQGLKVKRIRRAMLDKETGKWTVSEYLCEGANLGDAAGNAEQLDEYEAPYDRSPYFIVESGPSLATEQDPHRRYRPRLYPLTVAVQELNMWETAFKQATFWRLQNPYVYTLQGVDPESMRRWTEAMREVGFAVTEGAGAEQQFWVRAPEVPADGIAVVPRIEGIPEQDMTALLTEIQMVQQEINDLRTNRYLIGDAPTSTETATQTLNQQEAAAVPHGLDLTNVSLFWEDSIKAEFQAFCQWDYETPSDGQKPHVIRVAGDMPTREFEKPREIGEEVTITADVIKAQDYMVTVSIANETRAERQVKEQAAAVKHFEWRGSTRQQFLKDIGYDDPKKQEELLEEERRWEQQQPYWDQFNLEQVRQLVAAMSGLGPNMLPPAAMQEPGQTQPGQAGAPPALGVHNGRAPATQGPSGASNPMAGVMS